MGRRENAEIRASTDARYRALAECVTDVLWSVGMDLRYTYVSKSAVLMFGWEPDEAIGLSLFHTVAPELRERAERTARRAIELIRASSDPASVVLKPQEVEQIRRDGRRIWTEVQASPLVAEDGRVAGLVGVTRDITARKVAAEERRRMEVRLREAEKIDALGRMAGGVAHDFNNLLTVVMANASMALAELPEGSPAREAIAEIEEAAGRAAELSEQILACSGRSTYRVQPLDVSDVVGGMRELLATSLSKEVGLELRLARGLPTARADATQLRQVLLHLVVNAGEAVSAPWHEGDAGRVTVETGLQELDAIGEAPGVWSHTDLPPGRYVFASVRDEGPGMDAETLSHVFEPFFTTKFTGRGLGLAASAGIVRGHGGAIRAESAPGSGAVFSVLLPASATECSATSLPVEGERPRGTVLVVDDEKALVAVARRVLQKAGYRVYAAMNGAEAVQQFSELRGTVDVVLLDLSMPRLGGEATFLRLLDIDPRAQVVLTSGFPEEAATDRFGRGRLAGFLKKPYRPAELLAAVIEALDR